MFASACILAAGIVWGGVVPGNHLGGRLASPGYLQGKVILVDCRDYARDAAALERLENFWQSYKNKPFVLLGSHRGSDAEAVRRNLKAAGVSYPVYADATFEAKTFEPTNGLLYVIHEAGRMALKTREPNRAYEAVVNALTWGAVPAKELQYRKLIDYELQVLPGKAYGHIRAMRKAFPREAEYYAAAFKRLEADDEVKRVAKLEDVARRVKDFDPQTKRNGKAVHISRTKVESLIAKYADLKGSANPLIVQEAKNCIADLTWALADP